MGGGVAKPGRRELVESEGGLGRRRPAARDVEVDDAAPSVVGMVSSLEGIEVAADEDAARVLESLEALPHLLGPEFLRHVVEVRGRDGQCPVVDADRGPDAAAALRERPLLVSQQRVLRRRRHGYARPRVDRPLAQNRRPERHRPEVAQLALGLAEDEVRRLESLRHSIEVRRPRLSSPHSLAAHRAVLHRSQVRALRLHVHLVQGVRMQHLVQAHHVGLELAQAVAHAIQVVRVCGVPPRVNVVRHDAQRRRRQRARRRPHTRQRRKSMATPKHRREGVLERVAPSVCSRSR
mmetsp:Transcript_27969/g.85820  ORF Transcript_27969/g.85820 Transcript_27969/m.85820 type:complete len:293 (+) Transcript_27969:274-1152(+)